MGVWSSFKDLRFEILDDFGLKINWVGAQLFENTLDSFEIVFSIRNCLKIRINLHRSKQKSTELLIFSAKRQLKKGCVENSSLKSISEAIPKKSTLKNPSAHTKQSKKSVKTFFPLNFPGIISSLFVQYPHVPIHTSSK